ncbi:MAG: TraM recognition domain-containing protein, partial [bacterium]|nr:TraM recognition domain-containing protein [bacterium]
DKRHLVVSGLMATFKKIWVDAWSARMEYILTNTLLALLEYPGATLLGVNRMYTDKNYRKKVVENIKDPVVKDFWISEFANYGDRYTQEATPAIQNKIGQFTSNPLIRNIIGQPHSSFDIRDLMDSKKILLVNLSKGLVGDTNMQLLGSMLTTRIFLGAMSRADLPSHELAKVPSFYFYVDEFQNFANESFSEILSEARKYQLSLIIAHQYVAQMEEEVQAAVFGNVGSTVSFRVGPLDAELLEKVFMPKFLQEDLVNLGFTQIYLSLMIDGVGSQPFSAVTIPGIEPPPRSYRQEVLENSRQQFATKRAGIENAILTELSQAAEEAAQNHKAASAGPSNKKPGMSAPRREERPLSRDSRQEVRATSRPERTERPAPPAAAKTADDLKAILRATVANVEKDKQKKQGGKQESLKDALRSTIGTVPKPEAPPPPKSAPKEPKPVFEVPEETLRSLFKDV